MKSCKNGFRLYAFYNGMMPVSVLLSGGGCGCFFFLAPMIAKCRLYLGNEAKSSKARTETHHTRPPCRAGSGRAEPPGCRAAGLSGRWVAGPGQAGPTCSRALLGQVGPCRAAGHAAFDNKRLSTTQNGVPTPGVAELFSLQYLGNRLAGKRVLASWPSTRV